MKQAVILAAGRGRRLDRQGKPKPLVEVGNVPMIVRLMESLAARGVQKFVIVVGYEAEQVVRTVSARAAGRFLLHFPENPDFDGGLAKSVLCARPHVAPGAPIWRCMGDHVLDERHFDCMAKAQVRPKTVCLLVQENPPPEKVRADAVKVRHAAGRVEAIGVDVAPWTGVDMGLFAADPENLFGAMETAVRRNPDASLSDGLMLLVQEGRLDAQAAPDAGWDDVDTPEDLIAAEMRLRAETRAGVLAAHVQSVSTRTPDAVHDFVVGEPVTTKMVLMRGFFRAPEDFEFIPRESASSPVFLFSDETVTRLYAAKLHERMRRMGYNAHLLTMPDGEGSKSLSSFVELTERVLRLGVDERSVFVSVGGGVVCNVCGFIASCIYRGLTLVHIPTSLMAQCDAAISHKQAINGAYGKNMIGSYYSPRMVLVDVETLSTLPGRLIPDGMAEVIKHALCQDPAYVDFLLSYEGDFVRDIDFLERVVTRNIRLKCELSRVDPREHAEGMVLQYGHTVGHPVEHQSGYELYHGESVALGMLAATRVSRILNVCGPELVDLHVRLVKKYRLPAAIPAGISVDGIMTGLRYNKRYLTEGTRMCLLADVGKPLQIKGQYVIPVSDAVIRDAVVQTMEA